MGHRRREGSDNLCDLLLESSVGLGFIHHRLNIRAKVCRTNKLAGMAGKNDAIHFSILPNRCLKNRKPQPVGQLQIQDQQVSFIPLAEIKSGSDPRKAANHFQSGNISDHGNEQLQKHRLIIQKDTTELHEDPFFVIRPGSSNGMRTRNSAPPKGESPTLTSPP